MMTCAHLLVFKEGYSVRELAGTIFVGNDICATLLCTLEPSEKQQVSSCSAHEAREAPEKFERPALGARERKRTLLMTAMEEAVCPRFTPRMTGCFSFIGVEVIFGIC